MNPYGRYLCPCLTHLAMSAESLRPYRHAAAQHARGRVLEIGIGSGRNFDFYGNLVESVVGVDPSPALLQRASTVKTAFPVDLIEGEAEALPFPDSSFDSVVSTWTLCSVTDPRRVLQEIHRVLRPSGEFLYVEHGQAPDEQVARWQDRLNPLWRPVAGGCNLNRPVSDIVAGAGMQLLSWKNEYAFGPRLLTYFYQGRATPEAGQSNRG